METLMLVAGFAAGLIIGVFGAGAYCVYISGVFDISKPHDDYD